MSHQNAPSNSAPEFEREITYFARCLEGVLNEPIKWLWKLRFALGKICLLAGQPGMGKSQFALWMASVTSVGGLWPDGTRAPIGNVVIISCEDDVADTIGPRLDANRAAKRRIYSFDGVPYEAADGTLCKRPFCLDSDVDKLRQLCEDIDNVKLIIIDPVLAFMGSSDSHKTSDVRSALLPLQELAEYLGACILLITHLNKGTEDGSAISRVSGSTGFVAAVRSAWLAGRHPTDQTRRVITPLKNNVGDDKTGYAYSIVPVDLPDGVQTSCIELDHEPIEVAADQALGRSSPDHQDSAIGQAIKFLETTLSEEPQLANDIIQSAEQSGIAPRTLRRARIKMNVMIKKDRSTGCSLWCRRPDQLGQDGQDSRPQRTDQKSLSLVEPGQVGQVHSDASQEDELCARV